MIISSQRYIDNKKVEQKMNEIGGRVTLPVLYAGEYEGEAIYILVDGHHTAEAARELCLPINYETIDAKAWGYDTRWTLEDALENLWMDSDWYDVETGSLAF